MAGTGVEVTLVPHGFEVDVWQDCEEPPGQKRTSGFCFDFGDNYPKVGLLADRLAAHLVQVLRDEPDWLCSGAG